MLIRKDLFKWIETSFINLKMEDESDYKKFNKKFISKIFSLVKLNINYINIYRYL